MLWVRYFTCVAAWNRLAIRSTEWLLNAGIEPSSSGVGDSYDNALGESVNDRFIA